MIDRSLASATKTGLAMLLLSVASCLNAADTQQVDATLAAAEQGNAAAQHLVAMRYYQGNGVPQDYSEAVIWAFKAANQGNPASQHLLGNLFLTGKGVLRDFEAANAWFTKAAEQGYVKSQLVLANQYTRGIGVLDQDYGKAAGWFTKAAEQGSSAAQRSLGELYAQGQGVTQDNEQAYKWLYLAAAGGDQMASAALDDLATNMTADQVRAAERLAAEYTKTN